MPTSFKEKRISARVIAVVSGGMDSVTLAHLLASEDHDLHLISFYYGQRHKKEISYAQRCAERLRASFDVADISGVGRLLSGSALTDASVEVPHGDYAADNMLKLLGRYDGLALDSWLRAQFYKKHNRGRKCPDKKIEKHYAKYGDWKGLAIWCDMTEDWFAA